MAIETLLQPVEEREHRNGTAIKSAARPVVVRLNPDAPGHFGLYSIFEDRVIAFLKHYEIDAAEKVLRQELRTRFIQTPHLAGYFLICHPENEQVMGHLCGWFVYNYGTPLIHLAQAQVDEHGAFVSSIKVLAAQVFAWWDDLDAIYEKAAQNMRIAGVELITWHDKDKWEALLAEFVDVKKTRSVLRLMRKK